MLYDDGKKKTMFRYIFEKVKVLKLLLRQSREKLHAPLLNKKRLLLQSSALVYLGFLILVNTVTPTTAYFTENVKIEGHISAAENSNKNEDVVIDRDENKDQDAEENRADKESKGEDYDTSDSQTNEKKLTGEKEESDSESSQEGSDEDES